jgi:hypothetical protein
MLKEDRFAVAVVGSCRDKRPGRGGELVDVAGALRGEQAGACVD